MQLEVVKLHVHGIINILLIENALPFSKSLTLDYCLNLCDSDHFSKKHILNVKKKNCVL